MTLDKEDIYDIAKAIVKVIEDKDMMKSEEKKPEKRKNMVPLSSLYKRDCFLISGREWVVLAQDAEIDQITFVITKECLEEQMIFDEETNNWYFSSIKNKVNDVIQKEVISQFGKNIIKEEVIDTNPLDFSGYCNDFFEKVGLLGFDEYRTFRRYIPQIEKQWVLVTPYSSCDKKSICCVSSHGTIVKDVIDVKHNIRPVCILSNKGVLVEKVSD